MGGIYTLEQLTLESKARREPVSQILEEFVHEQTRSSASQPDPEPIDITAASRVLTRMPGGAR